MAYTQAQLVAAYTAANNGVAPDAATTALLSAFAAQTQTGQLSDSAALNYVINSADNDVAVAAQAYQFFTGKTPTKAGLDYLTNSATNTTDLNDPYYAAFNLENRYMNFAANLGIVGEGATAFNATYGTVAIPTWSQFVGTAYEAIIGSSYAAAAGINVAAAVNDVTSRQAAFTQIARERGIITATSNQAQIDIATRAVAIGYLMAEGIKADVGIYAAGSNNFVQALVNGNAQYNVNLLTTYSVLGGGTGSPSGSTGVGVTLSLTVGGDVLSPTSATAALKTTAGDDKIFALTNDSLTSADVIDAGNGNDSIVANIGTTGVVTAPSLTSVESVTIVDAIAAGAGDTVSFSAANVTGLTSLTLSGSQATAGVDALAATGLGANVAAGIANNGASANTYTFTYADAAVAGTADTLTLNLNSNAATGAVRVTSTTGTTLASGFETVNIVTGGTASTLASLAVDNSNASLQTMSKLNITGSAALTITGSLDFAGTATGTIVSTSTAAVTLTATAGEAITFTGGAAANTITTGAGNDILTGGAGDDSFTIGTGNDTVVGGAGNDKVTVAALADLTSSDSISLGDGARDTLAIGGLTAITAGTIIAANKTLLTNSTAEVIELTAANVTAIDYSAISQDIVRIATAGTSNDVITNVATNDTLIVGANLTGVTGASTINASGVLPNQTFRLELAGTATTSRTLTNVATAATDHALELSSNITTLAIDSAGAAGNTIGGALNAGAFAIKNTSAQTVVVTGAGPLTIVNTASVGTTFSNGVDVQAGALTGVLTIGGSAQADIITGGTANDIITAGAGNDTINLASGGADKFNFVTHTTNGTDTINGFAAAASGGDTLNIAALGDGTTTTLTATITTAAAQQALVDDSSYIINTTGAVANLTTGGVAALTDFTNLTQVAAYLNERFTTTATNEDVFIVNQTGTNNTYVYSYVDAGTASIAAAELQLVGVVNNGGASLISQSIVFV